MCEELFSMKRNSIMQRFAYFARFKNKRDLVNNFVFFFNLKRHVQNRKINLMLRF